MRCKWQQDIQNNKNTFYQKVNKWNDSFYYTVPTVDLKNVLLFYGIEFVSICKRIRRTGKIRS